MACCRQSTSPLTGLVDRAVIVGIVLDFFSEAGLEPDHGTLHKQNLGVALVQKPSLEIPLAAFNIEATNVDSVLRRRRIFVLNYLIVKDQLINRNFLLSGVVLETTCQEPLCEEELINPIERWNSVMYPC